MKRFPFATVPALLALALCAAPSYAAQPAPRATAHGGSHQLNALQGCMNQWLFNGIWRIRVLRVAPITRTSSDLPGYGVTIEVRNGAQKSTVLVATGVRNPINLILDDGSPLDFYTPDNLQWSTLYNETLPPSAGFTYTLNFSYDVKPQTVGKPQKLLIEIDPGSVWQGQPHYTTSQPSLRIDLTCNRGG